MSQTRIEENMNYSRTMKLATFASALMLLSMAASSYPVAHAYGPAQWQAAFSGTFVNAGVNRTGFWGWCMFGGSALDGMSGTDSDCQVTFYGFNTTGAANVFPVFHQSIHGTAWKMAPSSSPPPPGLPPDDFFITDGSVSYTSQIFRQPPPPNCTISGQTVTCITPSGPVTCMLVAQTLTCSIPAATALHLYMADTFIPTVPNHYSFAKISAMFGMEIPPGVHINIQVNQLP